MDHPPGDFAPGVSARMHAAKNAQYIVLVSCDPVTLNNRVCRLLEVNGSDQEANYRLIRGAHEAPLLDPIPD